MRMATTSTQQTNGANTLIVSSSLIPLSSSSQLSSVNSSALASGHQSSLIAAQNQLAQQQPFVLNQVFNPHETFQLQQLYQQQMFLPQASLIQQNATIQNAAHEQHHQQLAAAAKKKANKQQKIVSKTSNQLQQPVLKTNHHHLIGQPHQFTTHHANSQAVVIGQLPNVTQQTIAAANKKVLDSQKNKQILIQNNAITQQSLVGSQFKPAHLQSPQLINQTQLIAPIQQLPPQSPIAWAQTNQSPQLVQSSPQIQQLFIQNSNPGLQMPGTPTYLNHSAGGYIHLLPNHTQNLNASVHHHQPIIQTSNQSAATTNTIVTSGVASSSVGGKLKAIKPASSLNALNNVGTQSGLTPKTVKQPLMPGEKKMSKKEQAAIEKAKSFAFKSTQQMNAELLAEKNRLQRSESMKSLDSAKSKADGKLLKKAQSSSLDDDSSNSLSAHTNGSLKKSEKKVKQKAIVKPQILSHCVDGYIIHESSFPFPINVTEELNDELEQIKLNNNGSGNATPTVEKVVKSKKLKKFKLKSAQQPSVSPTKVSPPINSNDTVSIEQPIGPVVSTPTPISNLVEIAAQPAKKAAEKEPVQQVSKEEIRPQTSSSINKEKKSNVVSVAPIAPISESSSSQQDESSVFTWSAEQVYEYLIKHDVSDTIAAELRKAQIDGRSLTLLSIPILKDKFQFKLGPILSLKKKIEELKAKCPESSDVYLPASGENIYNWSVKDTYQFILHLSSKEHAEEFERQEMDGHSLTLISTDNIVNDMNIPFGPALTIFNRIEELKKNSAN